MPSERPIIILYTEAAEISEEVLSAMPAAGYLPVKVSDPGAVRVLEIPSCVANSDMDAITVAALVSIKAYGGAAAQSFGSHLAKLLLEAKELTDAK